MAHFKRHTYVGVPTTYSFLVCVEFKFLAKRRDEKSFSRHHPNFSERSMQMTVLVFKSLLKAALVQGPLGQLFGLTCFLLNWPSRPLSSILSF